MTTMRYVCVAALVAVLILPAQTASAAGRAKAAGSRTFKDIYGNSYKNLKSLFSDKDKNGVRNIFQKRDRQTSRKNRLSR